MAAYKEEDAILGLPARSDAPCGVVKNISEICQEDRLNLSDECSSYCDKVDRLPKMGERIRSLIVAGADAPGEFDWFLSDCLLQGRGRSIKCWKQIVAEDGFCYMTDLLSKWQQSEKLPLCLYGLYVLILYIYVMYMHAGSS